MKEGPPARVALFASGRPYLRDMEFVKLDACGNDFIALDLRELGDVAPVGLCFILK